MEKLTKAEERIMQALWSLERAALGDIRAALPKGEEIPPTTVASMVKVLVNKGFVIYETFGRTNIYTPNVSKSDYRKFLMNNMVSNYFDGSFKKMVSFFAKEEKLDKGDIEDLLKELEED
ncbi:MAG: BlaI/MecI/CopY family transcriptional regulator [Chitinophagales bacterium]